MDITEAKVDLENKTVRQTIIRAGKSKNNRMYSEEVLRTASPLFEAAKAFADHPSKSEVKDRPERSIRAISGWFSDVAFEEGALVATRHFTNNESGKDSWALVEQIVTGKAPATLMGASINAVGRGRMEKVNGEDILVVESIEGVVSCDDVSQPAAAGGWQRLVASDNGDLTSELLKLSSFEEWQESQPDYVERLKKEWKTVRLEDVTKQSLAEADQKVKTANDQATVAHQALNEAQTTIQGFDKVIAKLTETNTQLRRELALEKTLAKSKLPALYMEDLRKRLPDTPETEWISVIETEQSKARRSELPTKVPVNGAGYQEAKAPERVASIEESVAPLPHEDTRTWMERMERLSQLRN